MCVISKCEMAIFYSGKKLAK
uniref:Uncharacterized protein n=1 Tax=Anguilla anguilla TaxID=7936 RepID=A0A0E9VQK8_ANGAN